MAGEPAGMRMEMFMENDLKSCLEMNTLLLCADAEFLGVTRAVLAQLKVAPKVVGDSEAAVGAIQSDEFDAIILDWREISNLPDFLIAVSRSKLNRGCVLVAVVRDLLDLREAFAAGVHFLIHKPASPVQIERCLRAAYCASIARRRKLHREPVNIVGSVSTRSQPLVEVTIVNLSETGARVKLGGDPGVLEAKLSAGEDVDLRFALPETDEMAQRTAMVVWTSAAGDAGLRFSYVPEGERAAIEQWLTGCVERARAESCARLRSACA